MNTVGSNSSVASDAAAPVKPIANKDTILKFIFMASGFVASGRQSQVVLSDSIQLWLHNIIELVFFPPRVPL